MTSEPSASARPRRTSVLVALAVVLGVALLGALVAATRPPAAPDAHVVASAVGPATSLPSRVIGTWPTTTTTTTTTVPPGPDAGLTVSGPVGPPWPQAFVSAWATVPQVPLFASPGVPVPTRRTLANPTHEHAPLVFLVRRQVPGWLQVQVPSRPNGATAWIRATDVRLDLVPNHILIELGAKRLTVLHGDEVVFTTSVAPGKASSPTPTGSFYVDVLAQPRNPNGPYGKYQVSFTGFSNVYDSFGGGNGQVAMHGTNRPELIGTPASHGCVRLTNDDITTVLGLAPHGTPVDVVP